MKNIAFGSGVHVESGGESLISTSGASLLLQTASVSGLAKSLSAELSSWRKPLAVHDPAKMILDLAVAIAAGGDCLADVALLRAQPEIFGPVASDPTFSRLLDTSPAMHPRRLPRFGSLGRRPGRRSGSTGRRWLTNHR